MSTTPKNVETIPVRETSRNDFIKEDFILHTIACYRAIRQSLLQLLYEKRTEKTFTTIQSIVNFRGLMDEDEIIFNIPGRLLQELTRGASEGSFVFIKLQDTLTASVETLLKDHLSGLQKLERKTPKLCKGKQTACTDSKLNKGQKVSEDFFTEKNILELGNLERRLAKEKIYMVRIAQKMAATNELKKLEKHRILQVAKITISLIKEMEFCVTQNGFTPEAMQTNVAENTVVQMLNDPKKQRRFGIQAGKNTVSAVPYLVPSDSPRHVNYNMFIAESFKPTDGPVSARCTDGDTLNREPTSPISRDDKQDIHATSMEIDIDEDEAGGDVINPLTNTQDVYVTVTREYSVDKKGHLNLKAGMQIKQKFAANADGLAYGWTRKSRFAKKKYGLYPISHVH